MMIFFILAGWLLENNKNMQTMKIISLLLIVEYSKHIEDNVLQQ